MKMSGTYVMRRNVIIALGLVLLRLSHTVDSAGLDVSQCDSYVQRTNGVVCYQTIDTPDPWNYAQLVCNARNMTIAEILTPEENNAVLNLLNQKNMVDSWLNAIQSNETWRWLDGVELSDQGCFVDNPQSPDLENVTIFPDNSVSKCLAYCRDLSYTYASVEARTQCHCGYEFGKYGQHGANCGNQCPGLSNETCGGDTSQQVYAVNGAYTNWIPGQPNNAYDYQSCATVDSSVNYKWQDVFCRDGYKGICEIPMQGNSCSAGTSLVMGRCLRTTDSELNFFKTRYACRSYGGDLIRHVSTDDTAAIATWLNLPSNSTIQFYIGLTKWAWKWQSGTEFLYTNWKSDQPTGPNLNCITIKRDNNPGEWADISCDSSHLYICQKSNATVTVTAPPFTVAPTTTRKTAPPPLTLNNNNNNNGPTTKASGGAAGASHPVTQTPPYHASSNNSTSSLNLAAVIGGAVAGGIVLVVVVIFVIVICVVASRRSKTPPPSKAALSPSKGVPSPPAYFFGIETTPKYRDEPRVYPSLPDFNEKSNGTIAAGSQKRVKKWNSVTPDVVPVYPNMTLVPVTEATNSAPTPYSADIFINPELSY